MIKVEGHSHLLRDESSTAIVSTDYNAYIAVKRRRPPWCGGNFFGDHGINERFTYRNCAIRTFCIYPCKI